MHRKTFLVLGGLMLILVLAGCSSSKAEPTWTPAPTWTPVPTWTPAPTFTPYPTPYPTSTPQPTYTPQPTVKPTADNPSPSEINQAITAYNAGVANSVLGKHHEAIADYTRVISLDPAFVKAYLNRGIAKGHLLRYGEAIADFAKAKELGYGD